MLRKNNLNAWLIGFLLSSIIPANLFAMKKITKYVMRKISRKTPAELITESLNTLEQDQVVLVNDLLYSFEESQVQEGEERVRLYINRKEEMEDSLDQNSQTLNAKLREEANDINNILANSSLNEDEKAAFRNKLEKIEIQQELIDDKVIARIELNRSKKISRSSFQRRSEVIAPSVTTTEVDPERKAEIENLITKVHQLKEYWDADEVKYPQGNIAIRRKERFISDMDSFCEELNRRKLGGRENFKVRRRLCLHYSPDPNDPRNVVIDPDEDLRPNENIRENNNWLRPYLWPATKVTLYSSCFILGIILTAKLFGIVGK